jgi:hypothetical protein
MLSREGSAHDLLAILNLFSVAFRNPSASLLASLHTSSKVTYYTCTYTKEISSKVILTGGIITIVHKTHMDEKLVTNGVLSIHTHDQVLLLLIIIVKKNINKMSAW